MVGHALPVLIHIQTYLLGKFLQVGIAERALVFTCLIVIQRIDEQPKLALVVGALGGFRRTRGLIANKGIVIEDHLHLARIHVFVFDLLKRRAIELAASRTLKIGIDFHG